MSPIKLKEMLKRHEGLRLKSYYCSEGVLTIGYGHTGPDVYPAMVIDEDKADHFLDKDIARCFEEAAKFPWFDKLNDARQDVIISMLFNLGLPRFLGFKKMLAALEEGWFTLAAKEMIDSKWCAQVGLRATELALIMETGAYPDE